MKLHLGKTKRRGWIGFLHDGYWLREADERKSRFVSYLEPRRSDLSITRMIGVSFGGVFIGLLAAKADGTSQTAKD